MKPLNRAYRLIFVSVLYSMIVWAKPIYQELSEQGVQEINGTLILLIISTLAINLLSLLVIKHRIRHYTIFILISILYGLSLIVPETGGEFINANNNLFFGEDFLDFLDHFDSQMVNWFELIMFIGGVPLYFLVISLVTEKLDRTIEIFKKKYDAQHRL